MNIYNAIQHGPGFYLTKFNLNERKNIKNLITKKFESNLKKFNLVEYQNLKKKEKNTEPLFIIVYHLFKQLLILFYY